MTLGELIQDNPKSAEAENDCPIKRAAENISKCGQVSLLVIQYLSESIGPAGQFSQKDKCPHSESGGREFALFTQGEGPEGTLCFEGRYCHRRSVDVKEKHFFLIN